MEFRQSGGPSVKRKRILFLAEAVTLAHVARPAALATVLVPSQYEVFFAVAPRYDQLLGHVTWVRRGLNSISSRQFMAALAAGRPLYDVATLRDYVREDLRLIEDLAPDLIVGDFRFVVIEKVLSRSHNLSFYESFIMAFYKELKKISLSEERGFGLDLSFVTVEKVPLMLAAPETVVIHRVL